MVHFLCFDFVFVLILRSALFARVSKDGQRLWLHGSRRRTGQRKSVAGRAPPHHEASFYFLPASSFAACPNMFFRASSSHRFFSNLPIASPACTFGRARTSAYQRLMFG